MSEVTLTGYILVPSADLEAVIAELPTHIALTHAEPGCLSFEVLQDQENPLRFTVNETFTDADAFADHQARVRASKWGAVTENVERHYTIKGANPI